MSSFQKLKNQARREEQRSNWAGAIELYKQAIKLDEDVSTSVDLSLYNRIGDLYLRLGNLTVAVEFYEQTVDLYAKQDMHTSAIALCNKILRIMPDHMRTYRRLGRLHAQTGLLAEARANYLQFANRAQEADELGDALEALQEFVDLSGDEAIRGPFAESLVERGLPAEAVAQLRLVWESLVARGSDADEVRDRILEIDPNADPRTTAAPTVSEAPSPVVIQGIQDAEALAVEDPSADDDAEPGPAVSGPAVSPPAAQLESDGTVNLARLINEELGEIIQIDEADQAADPAAAVSTAAEAAALAGDTSEDERNTVIDQFRSEIGRIVEDSDYSVHYDLGVAYMSMGLIDEAVVEFKAAMQGESYLSAAHEMIGECLRIKAGEGRQEPAAELEPEPMIAAEPEVLVELVPEPAVESPPEPEPEPVVEPEPFVEPEPDPVAPQAGRSNDALASLLFEARLAQYRARKAESQHDTDYQAHFDLGAAYQEMGLIKEALREYRVAVGGSRMIATRVINALEKIGRDDAVSDDMRLLSLECIPIGERDAFALQQYLEMHDRWVDAGKDCARIRERIEIIEPDAVPALPDHLDISTEQVPELEDILAELGPLDDDLDHGLALPEVREATDVEEPPYDPVTLDMVPLDDIESVMAYGPEAPLAELEDPEQLLELEPEEEVAPLDQPDPTMVDSAGTEAVTAQSPGEAELKRALRFAEAGDLTEAEVKLRTALRLFENDGEYRKALSVLDALLSIEADDVVLHHQRAEYAIMLNDRVTLLQSYMDLGATLRRQNAPRSARSVFGRVLEIDPENADALRAIGELDELELTQERERRSSSASQAPTERADFDGLLDDLKSQVTEQPAHADYESHLELGLAFKEMNMLDEAIRELQIAVRGLASPFAAYEALGEAFIANGQAAIGSRALERAVELDGDDERKVGCLYWLGVAAQELDELAQAREYFERVMTVDIDYRDTVTRITACSL